MALRLAARRASSAAASSASFRWPSGSFLRPAAGLPAWLSPAGEAASAPSRSAHGGSSAAARRARLARAAAARAIERRVPAAGAAAGAAEAAEGAPAAYDAVAPEGAAAASEVASVVSHPALVVTRPIEWGTVLLGFEQANRYTVFDERGAVVAHLLEEEGGLGKALARQFLRTHRGFTATVLSPDGSRVVMRLRRPTRLINSRMILEDGEGNELGEIVQRWHLLRRKYDLYLDRRQVAEIDAPTLAWEFPLKDEQGNVLAVIDRNFSGFGKELFTDAGMYAVHFGTSPHEAALAAQRTIAAAHPDKPVPQIAEKNIPGAASDPAAYGAIGGAPSGAPNLPPASPPGGAYAAQSPLPPPASSTSLSTFSPPPAVIATSTGDQVAIPRPMGIEGRMLALAAAISIDYDYFSRHSSAHSGGFLGPLFMPPVVVPVPYPETGGAASADAAAGAAVEAGAGDQAGAHGASPSDSSATSSAGLERDLGGEDSPFASPSSSSGSSDSGEWGEGDDPWSAGGSGGDDGEAGGGIGDFFQTMRDMFGDGDDDGW